MARGALLAGDGEYLGAVPGHGDLADLKHPRPARPVPGPDEIVVGVVARAEVAHGHAPVGAALDLLSAERAVAYFDISWASMVAGGYCASLLLR